MTGSGTVSSMFAVLAASLVLSAPAAADDDDAKRSLKAPPAALKAKGPDKPGPAQAAKLVKPEKPGKPVKSERIKAPPKPGVKTVIAPGTWKVHRHRGNSPLFKDGREKDWVTRPGPGKRPVIKRPDRPGNGPGNR